MDAAPNADIADLLAELRYDIRLFEDSIGSERGIVSRLADGSVVVRGQSVYVAPAPAQTQYRATRDGATLESDIRTHDWGRIALLADPFGHGFCLIEFLGRGYDEMAT